MIKTKDCFTSNLDVVYKLKTDVRFLRKQNKDLIHQLLSKDYAAEFNNFEDKIYSLFFLTNKQKRELIELLQNNRQTNKEYDPRPFKLKRYHALLLLKRTLIHEQIKLICIIANLLKEEKNV